MLCLATSLLLTNNVSAKCSKEDINYYLEKGFSPDQITSLCSDEVTLSNKKEEAYKWLRENGLGDLIKNEVTVAFGRSEDNKAQQYAVLAQGQGYEPIQKLKVEPMTLKALVRERVEAGLDMPSDLFNLFTSNRTKITRSK